MPADEDPHARPTAALDPDELARLIRRDETPARTARSSSSVRSARVEIRTQQLDPTQLGVLLAASEAPRTSPAVVARRADTEVDADRAREDKPTTAIDPTQLRALAAEATQALPEPAPRPARPRQVLARLPRLLPPAPDSRSGGTALVVLAIALAALALMLVLR